MRLIAIGLVLLLAAAGTAAPQSPPAAGYTPAPVPDAPAKPNQATAKPAPQPKQPVAPGSMQVRINGRVVTGVGVVSDSGQTH
jgi:uncharacterized Zn-binding protein involved in type VI secretion